MDAIRRPAIGALAGETAVAGRRPLSLAALVVAMALVAELAYISVASPRFAVRVVEVRGDESVAGQVAASIRLPGSASMVRAPLGELRRQASSCPAVREVRASRALPDRIVLTVERREPVAVIRRAEAAVLIDPEGVPFTVADEPGWGLPELSAPHLLSGDLVSKAARAEIADLLGVLRALGPDPRLRVTRLWLARDGRLELTLDSGTIVNLGAARELGAKARLLVAAIEQIGISRIKRLDLSIPGSAWWEPRDGRRSVRMR